MPKRSADRFYASRRKSKSGKAAAMAPGGCSGHL